MASFSFSVRHFSVLRWRLLLASEQESGSVLGMLRGKPRKEFLKNGDGMDEVLPRKKRYFQVSNAIGRSDLKSQISDLQIPNPKSQIPDLKSQISDLRSQISDLRSQISDLRSQISDSFWPSDRRESTHQTGDRFQGIDQPRAAAVEEGRAVKHVHVVLGNALQRRPSVAGS